LECDNRKFLGISAIIYLFHATVAKFYKILVEPVINTGVKTLAHQKHLKEKKLIPWKRVLLEKLTCSQLSEKFPAFYGT
jgi:hypothetical protein